jgi:hypothetical protein
MLNKHEIRGDHVALNIKKRDGRELEFLVDLSDFPILQSLNKSWCAMWSEDAKTWYVYHKDSHQNYKAVLLHRFLMNTPEHLHVDHKDHNGLNNRRENMRNVDRTTNQLNHRMQSNNTSGYRGVIWDKHRGLWQARVKVKYKNILVGRFATADQANAAIKVYRKDILNCFE